MLKEEELSEEINTANSIDITIDYKDYKKMRRLFPSKFINKSIIVIIIIAILDLIALIPDEEAEPLTVADIIISDLALLVLLFTVIILYSLISRRIKYKRLVKQSIDNMEYTVDIYADYLVKRGKNITQKVMFDDIKKYRETSDKLYLKVDKDNIIPLPELDMTSKEIDFIKYCIDTRGNKKNKDYSYYLRKKNNSENKNGTIRIILIILFVVTLLTPWISSLFISLLIIKNQAFEFGIFKYAYGALYALPIPLLSLILGIIYRIKGIKCLKNIIAGIIMTFIVLIISSLSISSSGYERDYSEIETYKDIIKIDLPKEGYYTRIEWDESYLKNHISSGITFKNEEEANRFYQDIINSEDWILKEDISTTLNNFVPYSMYCYSGYDSCYYSIYVKELGTYNLVPQKSGMYHIVTMLYDPQRKKLSIEDFDYTYKS